MNISRNKLNEYTMRLLKSRTRILCNHGFYGLLLMGMTFSIDTEIGTAATDGKRIIFSPQFLEELSDKEIDFILMHEILHVVLKHCYRAGKRELFRFNVACDIVVNSNILKSCNMDLNAIKVCGCESIHKTPNGDEGYLYTAEEVYNMLPEMEDKESMDNTSNGIIDNHSTWKETEGESIEEKEWNLRIKSAYEVVNDRKEKGGARGNIPLDIDRQIKELSNAQLNWKNILNDFIQKEVGDYTFFPPDKRYYNNTFFLPDYGENNDYIERILFMADTSGSNSDKELTDIYSEMTGTIEQFDGRIKGWLGFFDSEVVAPKPFKSEQELKRITSKGGGGTNFHKICKYIKDNMMDDPPVSIVILTDGYAPFPDESEAMGIPVLWIINNNDIKPPWGRVARIRVDENK